MHMRPDDSDGSDDALKVLPRAGGQDHHTLREYNVQKESVLIAVPAGGGGGGGRQLSAFVQSVVPAR